MYFFGILIGLMWTFILLDIYKKVKYQKREKWVKAFNKLSEGSAYGYVYEELMDLSYDFKGTASELIEQSQLPENEKEVALHYFEVNVYKTSSSLYGANKTINRVVWCISIAVVAGVYFRFMHGSIYSEEDLLIALFLLIFTNFVVQIVLHFLVLFGKVVFVKITSKEENNEGERLVENLSTENAIPWLKELLEKIIF